MTGNRKTWARIPAQSKATFFSAERFSNSLNIFFFWHFPKMLFFIPYTYLSMCVNFQGILIFFLYFGIFLFIFLFHLWFFLLILPYFPNPKKLLHIVRIKIKKESWQLVKNKKVIQSQKMSKKCPKNSKFSV